MEAQCPISILPCGSCSKLSFCPALLWPTLFECVRMRSLVHRQPFPCIFVDLLLHAVDAVDALRWATRVKDAALLSALASALPETVLREQEQKYKAWIGLGSDKKDIKIMKAKVFFF